jgi:TPR repeat protein
MYEKGQGVPQDRYRKAADQGNSFAQSGLGAMYLIGHGVQQDIVQAYMWFDLAAFHATDPARRDLAAKARDKAAAMMSPAQLAEARRLARESATTN